MKLLDVETVETTYITVKTAYINVETTHITVEIHIYQWSKLSHIIKLVSQFSAGTGDSGEDIGKSKK